MRTATKNDIGLVVNIITSTFSSTQGVGWMLSKRRDRQKQLACLARYAFIRSFLRDGAFISSNEMGVALCYRFNRSVFSIRELFYEVRFVVMAIGFPKLASVYRLERYKKTVRPKDGNYLYFWFFGVERGGQNAGFELRDGVFELARQQNLPIYAETSSERNRVIYERFGFETYHYLEQKRLGLQYWFMRWYPEKHPDTCPTNPIATQPNPGE